MDPSDYACPACGHALQNADGGLRCPACDSAYRLVPHCPSCASLLETIKACGAVDYFCPSCNELQSKRAVAFQPQAL